MYEGALFVRASTTNMWMHTLSPPFALLLLLVISAHNSPVYSAAALDLSPAASPFSAANNTSVTRGFAKPYQKLTILISTLFIAFLFLGFCAHYVTLRSCFNRRNSANRNSDFLAGLQPITNGPHRGEEEERGLESWLVKSLPVVKYTAKKDEQELEGGAATTAATAARIGEKVQVIKLQECAVCLSDYEEGEEMKELPMCGHRFHKACIDMWLFSHSTCPICRLSLRKHFKAAHQKSSTDQPASPRSPDSAPHPLPRASHVELTMPSDPPFASTSSGYRDSLVNSHHDVSTDEAEDARDSSAALHPHFLSSA